MGLFEQFPYTNFHGINLKWILDRMVDFETRLTAAEADIDALEARMDTAESDIDALEGAVGDLTQLATTDKTSLVAAINENEGRIDALESAVGDITQLATTDKTSLVAAINENEGRLDSAESDINTLEAHDLLLIEYNKTEIPDPYDYKDAILAGRRAVLHAKFGSNDYYLPLYEIVSSSSRCYLYFLDVAGEVSADINDQGTATHFCAVELRNSNVLGAPTWFGGSL